MITDQLAPTTIILCGGPINYSSLPVGTNQSNAMIPINGKPVIAWILDDLIAKSILDPVVVVRAQDVRLKNFLMRAYSRRMQVTICELEQEGTIVQSLRAGLTMAAGDGLVRIVLGDTLIRDEYHSDEDFVYVGRVDESRRWCLALTNHNHEVIDYADKQEIALDPKLALAGYYHLAHGDYLRACVKTSVANGETQLSDVLRSYGMKYPIRACEVSEWYDFGNIDNLVDARRRLLRPRHFNSLTIDPVLNTITKVSENNQKLRDELNWYLQLPGDLRVLTPRIVSHDELNGRIRIVQEYYGYPDLAELYVYSDLHADTWQSILKRIFRIHDEFRRYPGELAPEHIAAIYCDKTWERIETLRAQSTFWETLLSRDTLTINGREYQNIAPLHDRITAHSARLTQDVPVCAVHGDLCFSNILFDINNQIIRLIDPRGRFGISGIYGDPRYDIAKLRHSVCGLYDYIVADMFSVTELAPGQFSAEVFANGTSKVVGTLFDRLVEDAGYCLEDIRLIEGLIFISIGPLHSDYPERQLMMYLTGIRQLNEVFHAHRD